MANHTITGQYNDQLRKIKTTDPVHADLMNLLFGQLINNDVFIKTLLSDSNNDNVFVKALIDAKMHQTTGHKHTGKAGDAPQIGTAGIADGAITTDKLGTINYLNLGGGFKLRYDALAESLDFEAPVDGIPFTHTDTTLAGISNHIE